MVRCAHGDRGRGRRLPSFSLSPITYDPSPFVVPSIERGHGRANSGAKLDRISKVAQRSLQHGELRGENGRVCLGRSHVPEPEKLAEKLAVTRRDHDAVAMAHRLAQLRLVDALWHTNRSDTGRGDLLPRRPEL